jgi:predicted NACHT family NTPase
MPNVRQQLIERLEDGLESTDPETFKLAVQVSLIRRFRNFVRINEELEIDNSYITCAEYQQFFNETGETRQPEHWQRNRFPTGDAKKTITGISWENALRFCAWLGEWYRSRLGNQLSEMAVHYKLPTEEEINQYSINDEQHFKDSGIRLVKFQLPPRYSQLGDYLWSGEWQKADEETAEVMLQVAGKSKPYLAIQDIENFPCSDLRIINQLWVYASKGHFGFSVQKNIYHSLGGTREYNEKIWNDFGARVGWRTGDEWFLKITYTLDWDQSRKGHLPFNNRKGQLPNVGLPRLELFSRAETCRL